MFDFFRGLRRKLGCVTLVLATVLMTFWLRSLRRQDFIRFNPDASYSDDSMRLDGIATFPGGVHLYVVRMRPLEIREVDGKTVIEVKPEDKQVEYIWVWAGFSGMQAKSLLKIRFSWITIPLTLISDWLLVVKPRKANHAKLNKPADDNDSNYENGSKTKSIARI